MRGIARTAAAVSTVGMATATFSSAALASLPFSPNGDAGLWIVRRLWAPLTLKLCGVDVQASGDIDRLYDGQPRVIIANHQGYLDVPACFTSLPLPLRILAKKELFKLPFMGHFLKAFGFPPVDRARTKAALRSFDQATDMLRQGRSILVFPEGTRSPDGSLQPLKKGAFVMAIKAGVEIVPVGLSGSFEAFNRRDHILHPGLIHIHVAPPIPTQHLTIDDRDALLSTASQALHNACAEATHRRLATR